MKTLREYQQELRLQGITKVAMYGAVYLAMEVRTGKTAVALSIAKHFAKKVLFVTKKKAIGSIEADHVDFGFDMDLTVINYESIHKVEGEGFDFIILDEAHGLGGFPKQSKRHKTVKAFIKQHKIKKCVFLSGTPTPESYSQLYHQLTVLPVNPFDKYKTFYKWAADFVNVKQRQFGYGMVNDYSDANKSKIDSFTDYLFLNYTQKKAGFKSEVQEKVLTVPMKPVTKQLIDRLCKDKVVEGKEKLILADTAVKLMQKVHQISSGTIKFEDGTRQVLDDSKAEYIKSYFRGKKIAIIYKFIEEGNILRQTFPNHTDSPEEFQTTDKTFIGQVQSSREGTKLSAADCLVFYNIDFSATSYWQARDRMTTADRELNTVYWVFSDCGIEKKIYKTVTAKKDFTLSHFKKQFDIGKFTDQWIKPENQPSK